MWVLSADIKALAAPFPLNCCSCSIYIIQQISWILWLRSFAASHGIIYVYVCIIMRSPLLHLTALVVCIPYLLELLEVPTVNCYLWKFWPFRTYHVQASLLSSRLKETLSSAYPLLFIGLAKSFSCHFHFGQDASVQSNSTKSQIKNQASWMANTSPLAPLPLASAVTGCWPVCSSSFPSLFYIIALPLN